MWRAGSEWCVRFRFLIMTTTFLGFVEVHSQSHRPTHDDGNHQTTKQGSHQVVFSWRRRAVTETLARYRDNTVLSLKLYRAVFPRDIAFQESSLRHTEVASNLIATSRPPLVRRIESSACGGSNDYCCCTSHRCCFLCEPPMCRIARRLNLELANVGWRPKNCLVPRAVPWCTWPNWQAGAYCMHRQHNKKTQGGLDRVRVK